MQQQHSTFLKSLPKEVEKEREVLLELARKELEKYQDAVKIQKIVYERALIAIEKEMTERKARLQEAETKLQAQNHFRLVAQTATTTLEDRTLTLTSEITVVEARLDALNNDITTKKEERDRLDSECQTLHADIRGMTIQKEALESEIAHQTLQGDMNAKEAQKKLGIITLKLNESIKQLQDTQRQEETLRNDLASRLMSLDKREEVIINRENAVKMQEDRVYNYARALNI